jgi:DNA-directed RNA polymerase II subunit RPB2
MSTKSKSIKDSINSYSEYNVDGMDMEDHFKLIDLYFRQKYIMFSHLHNSFDKFIDDDIRDLLENGNNVFFEKTTKDKVYRYKFVYEDIAIRPPMIETEDEIMTPQQARLRDMTYSAKLLATITQVQEIVDIATGEIKTKVVGEPEKEYPVATIPIMVRSKYCTLNINKKFNKKECEYDPGGYFIINGGEKVMLSLERMVENKPFVWTKKDSNMLIYNVQVSSKSFTRDTMQLVNIRMKKENMINIQVPIINEISVFIVMRALGVETDRDIVNLIVYDKNDPDMLNIVRLALENAKDDKDTNAKRIITQDEALDLLVNKMRVVRSYKYSETDKDIKHIEKKMHLQSLLTDNFLPHVEGGNIEKAYYLGYMINRLLHCYLGRIPPDDRDSFVNKRVDLPGALLFDLFKQSYKKMLSECTKNFKKRNQDDNNPQNVINQIKPNIIESGLKTTLMTGNWNKKKGVAQVLQRLTYLQMLAALRRVNSPTIDASVNKLTSPRHLHPTQYGFLCYIETPEGNNVGLVKHLSLMGNVTIMQPSQIKTIKKHMIKDIINIRDVPSQQLNKYTKVFMNGEWIGLTEEPKKLYHKMKELKYQGRIDATTSVVHDIRSELECRELHVNCSGGRMFRPVLVAKDNKLVLNKEHIRMIALDGKETNTKVASWNKFMSRNPGVIEYIDAEEQFHAMLAMFPSDLKQSRDRSHVSYKDLSEVEFRSAPNRYDDSVYVRHTHCEFHPSMHIGVVASNITFCNCNQGPRNMFQFSQAKQAMGIPTTNYRDRLDLTYVLYHPQRPIVTTRSRKYVGTDILPTGENTIVAIACYTGFNQEDSVVMNKSAIDRGLMVATAMKREKSEIEKNQSTAQDDLFIKPDRSKVVGMSYGSYDKLNEFGFVPEETEVVDKDIIIGKVTPIQPVGNSTKELKDSSVAYKSHANGVVDRVWNKIYNSEGYEILKMRIRSERILMIGDKMCSTHGQKGTVGIILPQADMPFTKDGITPDIIMSPHAIPSRMTTGQLIECLVGKVSAILGLETDGTPYQRLDVESIKDLLEELGYNRNGYEKLYDGRTGKAMNSEIFIGPVYYQRLKHMVNDKIHGRARGPRTMTTRQPPEGRSRDGGLRFGEMERDCVISHGMSRFLKERMMETADAYTAHVCDKCGLFAQRMIRKDSSQFIRKSDVFWCPSCRNKTDVSKVRLPYAFKLMIQELMSMNIAPRIRTKSG